MNSRYCRIRHMGKSPSNYSPAHQVRGTGCLTRETDTEIRLRYPNPTRSFHRTASYTGGDRPMPDLPHLHNDARTQSKWQIEFFLV